MIALALAAAIAQAALSEPPAGRARFMPGGAVARAEVMVRIISGAPIRLGQPADQPGARLRSATVAVDGAPRTARLVEFQ